MDLLSHLRRVSSADLEAILVSRPEALALAERPRADLRDLAAALNTNAGLSGALAGLDRFSLQLLTLAASRGGTLEPDVAVSEGVPISTLTASSSPLSRRALAFTDGGRLVLPDEVAAAIASSSPLGPPIRALLEREPDGDLLTIACNLGLAAADAHRSALLTSLTGWFDSRANVRALMQEVSPRTLELFEAVRDAGGDASLRELSARFGTGVWEVTAPGGRGNRARGPLAWLWSRGLVFFDAWFQRVVISGEVEAAVRGRLFESWEPEPPPLETDTLTIERTPLAVIEEVQRLLWLLTEADVTLLKSGDLGVRDRRRIAGETSVPEQSVGIPIRLTIYAGLSIVSADTGERYRLRITDLGRRWLAAEQAAAWLTLFRGWLRAVTGPEPIDPAQPQPTTLLLEVLASLPEGRATTLSSLGHRLEWVRPASFPSDAIGERAAGWLAPWLHVLGIGPTHPLVGLSPIGRAALRGAAEAEIRRLLPDGVEDCAVQADLSVIVAGQPSADLARGLTRIAELRSSAEARVYRLTDTSLRRALDRGMTAGEIEGFLAARCRGELPSTVRELIRDAGRRHGRLRVGVAAVYVTGDDAALVAEVAQSRRLGSLRMRLVAPNVAVAEGRSVGQVMDALRRAGLMPVPDGVADAAGPDAALRVPPMPVPDASDPQAAGALARRLLSTSIRPRSTGRRARAPA